jgi:hypothetical protein
MSMLIDLAKNYPVTSVIVVVAVVLVILNLVRRG